MFSFESKKIRTLAVIYLFVISLFLLIFVGSYYISTKKILTADEEENMKLVVETNSLSVATKIEEPLKDLSMISEVVANMKSPEEIIGFIEKSNKINLFETIIWIEPDFSYYTSADKKVEVKKIPYLKKGFEDIFASFDADFVCLQETKLQEGQIDLAFPGYESHWDYAEKKGYSGTAIYTRHTPISVSRGIGIAEHDTEGRTVTHEYENFDLVCVYTPNSQDGLKRLDYRMKWEDAFRAYLQELDNRKTVIVCGDMNVAHNEIDLKNPSTNHFSAGFSDEERAKFTELLSAGFTDSFRHLHPDTRDAYSWWSYRAAARERNVGWRIDYFLCSDRAKDKIKDAYILPEVMGSDHCPVGLEIEL